MIQADSEQVSFSQFHCSDIQIKQKQEYLIEKKQEFNNQSNQKEFVSISDKIDDVCARTSTAQIQRDQQIRISKVDNISGPNATIKKPVINNNSSGTLANGIEERFKNIEQYLNIVYPPVPIDIYQRIKIIEDKLLKYEEFKSSSSSSSGSNSTDTSDSINNNTKEDKEEQLQIPKALSKVGKQKKIKMNEASVAVPVVRAAITSSIEEVNININRVLNFMLQVT